MLLRTAPAVADAPSLARSTASRLPRSSSTAVMLSADCSKVGSAPGLTGSEAPVPGWSKKMSRPSDVIASAHPWMDGSSGRTSQHVNQFGTNTMSRATRGRRAVGDAQVPVHRVARLREHCRSVSRGAGRIWSHRDAGQKEHHPSNPRPAQNHSVVTGAMPSTDADCYMEPGASKPEPSAVTGRSDLAPRPRAR